MKHMTNEKDNAIENTESLENQYEAVKGDIETLIIAQEEISSIGYDIETKLLNIVK